MEFHLKYNIFTIGCLVAALSVIDCLDVNKRFLVDTICEDRYTGCNANDCQQYDYTVRASCAKTCGMCRPAIPTPMAWASWATWTTVSSLSPVHGGWSSWIDKPCSVTCGSGRSLRYRTCTAPPPSNGGAPCIGDSTQEFYCFLDSCPLTSNPVDGHWSEWTQLGQCSHSCGTGVIVRHRDCNNPPPSGGGMSCPGESQQIAYCNAFACSVDGAWSGWTQWSHCSTSCGIGVVSRDRTCISPAPSGNGLPCYGNKTETHDCSSGPCAAWSHWFNGECSHSCGNGTMERLRHCSTGHDMDCPGQAYEIVPCSNVECV